MSRSSSSLKERIWKRLTLTDDPTEFREYQTTWLLRLCRRFHEAVALLLVSAPPLYEAFVIRNEQRMVLRTAVQFSFGLFLGVLFYLIILVELQMDEKLTYTIGICIALFLAIGNVVSSQIRCISLLVPIRFGTATGRNVMMAMVVVYLTAGPITNITNNLQEALRVIVCQLWKTFTLTKNRFELMFVPLGEAFVKIRANTDQTKSLLDTVNQASNTIEEELMGEDEINKLKQQNDYVDTKSHRSTNAYNNAIRWNTYADSRQEIRYNWTIPDFSILERETYQKSTQIPNEKEQTGQWRVELYPDGIMNALRDFISLRFNLVNDGGGLEKAIVTFKASIIDNQQTEVRSREELKELIANSNKIEWIQFCLKDWVFRNELLVNDTLTISIHISYYIKCSNHSTSLEPNVIKCDLFDDMGSLLEDHKYADVKLIANGKNYSVHRAILAARSGLFARMFKDLDIKSDKKHKRITMNVTDMDAELMDEMLRYIYTGKCKILNQVAEKLLVAADKYELEGLKTLCSQSMCKELSVKNAANMLVLANKYRLDELKSRVVTFIVENSVQVFNTTEWESKVVSNNQLLNEICKMFAYRLGMRLPL